MMNSLKDELPGYIIDKRYLVKDWCGEGGFGAVFKGVYQLFGERIRGVAIKIIKKSIPSGQEKEIFSEAIMQIKADASIKDISLQQKIVKVFDFGVIEEKERLGYIIMEFIEGGDLQQEIDRFNGKVPENFSIRYIQEICQGLSVLHKMNPPVIHRDIKAPNILLTKDKEIKISDFGLAAKLDLAYGWKEGVAGTRPYMAPETLTREGRSFTQSDVFSLGVMWYQMATGMLPWDDEIPPNGKEDMEAVNWRHNLRKNVVPQRPEQLNNTFTSGISEIIMRCLTYDHTKRFRDAGELLKAIKSGNITREECLKRADSYLTSGDYKEALSMVRRGLEMPSQHPDKTDFSLRFIKTCAMARLNKNHKETEESFIALREENNARKWFPESDTLNLKRMYKEEKEFCLKIGKVNIARILQKKIDRL